jgi:DNA-binding NarL/FixJ family response regulator
MAVSRKVRVLVANRPRLMRELVLATIGEQPDIEIVGEIQEEAEIPTMVERTNPDFVIIALGESDERPRICDWVLRKRPELRVLAIASDRNTTIYYWVSPEIRSSRIETSEGSMLRALRSVVDLAGR